MQANKIAIYQSLANNNPDVDAFYRLSKDIPLRFRKKNSVLKIMNNIYSPFNAQATLWRRNAFWGMIMPVSVHGRVTDIWRSYITSRLLNDLGYSVAFTSPFVTQIRNNHNLLADLQSEIPLYTQSKELINWLQNFPSKSSIEETMEDIAIGLYELGVLEMEDVELYQAWIMDLREIGYSIPDPESKYQKNQKPMKEPNSDPRVALCISGQIRSLYLNTEDDDHPKKFIGVYRYTIPSPNISVATSIKQNLYPKLGKKLDVFMHVLTRRSDLEPKSGDKSICEPLRPEEGNIECMVERELDLPLHINTNETSEMWHRLFYANKFKKNGTRYMQGLLKQLYSIYQCRNMIENYEKEKHISYSWIGKTRPDLFVNNFPNIKALAQDTNSPLVWFPTKDACDYGNEDIFGIGPSKWMRKYMDRYLYLQQHKWPFATKRFWDAEYFVTKIMEYFGVVLQAHKDIRMCVLKPLHRKASSDAR